jgi:DNA processing protein
LNTDSTLWNIALGMVEGIGPSTTKRLLQAFGNSEAIFSAGKRNLMNAKIAPEVVNQIVNGRTMRDAELEMKFVAQHNITPLFIGDENYPYRLRQCLDAPVILYTRGNFEVTPKRVLSIVGTRQATSFGKEICEAIIQGLAESGVLIVSGMAYGIDYCAHQAAVKHNLPTAAVFAHGLDIIYPSAHRSVAVKMLENGGWISEFKSGIAMDKNYFPRRNRIVAGISDGTLVIESDKKGGSLITADLAAGYNREVMAIPGRPSDLRSEGCNFLIKNSRAALVESAEDVLKLMNWTGNTVAPQPIQLSVFPTLSDEALTVARCMNKMGPMSIDSLADKTGKGMNEISFLLLNLELEGLVKALPGKRYLLRQPLQDA